ncbi:tRNA (cytidine(34)-2'-O)-methyltransferase [soil metagenome]
MFSIVFYQPEIPPNTGNAMRLAAITGCQLHLIEPLGYTLDDARLRRAGMDYRDRATVTVHPSLEECARRLPAARVVAFTVDATAVFTDVAYQPGDVLVFGPESVGLPEEVKLHRWVTDHVRIPMVAGVRSLNLSNAAAVVVYEAWRQNGFAGASGVTSSRPGAPNPY